MSKKDTATTPATGFWKSAGAGDLCVSTPGPRVSSNRFTYRLFQHRFPSRGVEQACRAPLNKALCSVLKKSARTLADVPARSFTSCYSTFPLFDSWSFMLLSPQSQTGLFHSWLQPCTAPTEWPIVSADLNNNVLKHLQVFGLFTMRFCHLPSQRGNWVTENQCQSV